MNNIELRYDFLVFVFAESNIKRKSALPLIGIFLLNIILSYG